MPYQKTSKLPGQRSSYISHLDSIQQEPVLKDILALLKERSSEEIGNNIQWSVCLNKINEYNDKPFKAIYCVDGSMQIIEDDKYPFKEIGFVKTSVVRINKLKLDKLDIKYPHPMQIKDILEDSSFSSSAVFPLKNIGFVGSNIRDSVRESIYRFISDNKFDGCLIDTIKWFTFKKWLPLNERLQKSELFSCPFCRRRTAYIPYDKNYGVCECEESKNNPIYITDWFCFHLDMLEEYASDKIINAYMNIMENLLLMASIVNLWNTRDRNNCFIKDCLFIKDGSLGLPARYAKFNVYIRAFINYAYQQGIDIHILGQEKSGIFFDYFSSIKCELPKGNLLKDGLFKADFIEGGLPKGAIFIPDSDFIKKHIKCENTESDYARTTNYGWKVLFNSINGHRYVLNIPVACNNDNVYYHNPFPKEDDVIGLYRILSSIKYLESRKYNCALYPIELAHSIASLSTYPSAKILKLFSNDLICKLNTD